MRFASIGASNASNYAAAGKAVADSSARVFDAQRKTGPDYAELSKTAMKTASAEKIAAMKAESEVYQAGLKQIGNVKEIAITESARGKIGDIKQGVRKAGVIAGIGAIAGTAYLASRDNEEGRERPKDTTRELYTEWLKNHRGIKDRHDQERSELGDGPEYTPYNPNSGTGGGSGGKVTSGSGSTTTTTSQVDGKSGWGRLSKVLRTGEGTLGDAGYTTMFTGARFSDTSRHPRQINRSGRHASDAAGAYQFLSTTWDGAKKALGLTDFSPQSQEKAGRYLTQKRGVNPDAVYNTKEELGRALDLLAPEWASMPTLATGTSYYGQGGISLDEAWRIYNGG